MRLFVNALSLCLLGSSGTSFASKCETVVIAGSPEIGPMAYNTKEIVIPASCKTFSITVENKNPAAMTKAAMGHNLVVVEAAKKQDVESKSIAAGLGSDYLAKGSGYVAASKLLGPGEKDTVKLEVAQLKDKALKFFCTFPGHSGIMIGDIKIDPKS